MNPRWILVGEVRGPEALDLVRAFNTGHCGAGTIHANSSFDALLTLEALILQSGLDVPARAVKEMVSRAIHVVLQMRELPDHSRRLMEIAEVLGLDYGRFRRVPVLQAADWLYRFDFEGYTTNGPGAVCATRQPFLVRGAQEGPELSGAAILAEVREISCDTNKKERASSTRPNV